MTKSKDRWCVVIEKILIINNNLEKQELIKQLINCKQPHVLAFINAHAMNIIKKSEDFFNNIITANTILRDGSGMSILYSINGLKPGLNLNGTDLIPVILNNYSEKKVALFGTSEEILLKAATNLKTKLNLNNEITTIDGFQNVEKYVDLARNEKPNVIVLGMGMPKQELVANVLRVNLNHKCLIICGGAIIDFMSGEVKRAPKKMRKIGLEWMYRFACEPKRLFIRYIIGNPIFLYYSLLFKIKTCNFIENKKQGN